MALIVEDGTVVVGAESYLTVSAADTYHANRGNTAWTDLDTPVKEQSLRKATDFMVQNYRTRWAGYRFNVSQPLDWPRAWVPIRDVPSGYGAFSAFVSNIIVPDAVKNACAELALKAATAELAPDLSQVVTREKIGPIEVDYQPYSPQQKRYVAIDGMLALLLLPGSGVSTPLVRV